MNEYYSQFPTVMIFGIVGIIILVYLIVFFKEIFFRRKGK